MIALAGAPLAMISSAAAIVALMLTTWLISVKLKNASIVDIIWGFGFVVVAWTVRLTVEGNHTRQNLLVALATIWGLRLALYLWWRNHGKDEDFRYVAMRRKHGQRFPIVSLYTVYATQGALMWIVSLPLQLGQVRATPKLGFLAIIGAVLWAIGLAFESVGDAQLTKFKSDPASKGVVMNKGLWRYTRHPNYFGDCCVWWGLGLIASETRLGMWGLIGSAAMNVLLRRVSGVTLLEKSLKKRRQGYDEYIRVTSPFIPRPPRKI